MPESTASKNLSLVSYIDQYLARRRVQTALIAAPSVAVFGDREFGSAPAHARKRDARSTNTHPISSRGEAAPVSQMPIAHAGSTHYRGSIRIRALDPAVHQMRPYP
jgi:hypothetical protein